jgi:hypothetical protein
MKQAVSCWGVVQGCNCLGCTQGICKVDKAAAPGLAAVISKDLGKRRRTEGTCSVEVGNGWQSIGALSDHHTVVGICVVWQVITGTLSSAHCLLHLTLTL